VSREVCVVATSTFYENIYIDEKAADIIAKGLANPKPPPPMLSKEEAERCERMAEQLLSNLDKPKANSSV
jgi:hypothetical protein